LKELDEEVQVTEKKEETSIDEVVAEVAEALAVDVKVAVEGEEPPAAG
jgi:hypothetical protein